MHESRKVFLIEESCLCIEATYNENDAPKQFKTFDSSIEIDDYLIVPKDTCHKMTVVKVTKINIHPDIKSDKAMDWVIGKVDRSQFEDTLDRESRFIQKAREGERKREMAQMKADIFGDVPEEELKMLSLSSQDGVEK